MIPIRNFPYTDYHDLNLDFLLRQFQIYEVDIEELKRRVKTLEDWRTDTVDPDLHDIKLTIIDIQGDIRNLGDRLTIVEGDVTINKTHIQNLKDNSFVVWVKYTSTPSAIEFRKGAADGEIITDLYNVIKAAKCANNPSYGYNNVRFIVAEQVNDKVMSADYYIDIPSGHPDTFRVYLFYTTHMYRKSINMMTLYFEVDNTNTVSSITSTGTAGNLVQNFGDITFSDSDTFESNTDPATSTEYPYYVEKTYHDTLLFASSIMEAYFLDFADMLTYSEIISDYIETGNQFFRVYFTRALTSGEEFTLNFTIIH